MRLEEKLSKMEKAGFVLHRKKHSLQEAKICLNPKTGTMMYEDEKGRLWSFDRQEEHFDVLGNDGSYQRINENGDVIGIKASTIPYLH